MMSCVSSVPITSFDPDLDHCSNGNLLLLPSASSRPLLPPHHPTLPLRRLCLLFCFFISIIQILFLHRRLIPLGPSLSTTPMGATDLAMTAKVPKGPISDLWNGTDWKENGIDIDHTSRSSPSSAPQFRHRRLPDCLIIGARKGGTRALLDALALHPRVRVARHEVHFFDMPRFYRMGPEWYRAQMPEATNEEAIVEKTPAYFTNPAVPKRVHALNPLMKMVLIVREPVARTISDFTQIRQTKMERHKAPIEFQRMSFTVGQNGSLALNTRFKPIRNSLYSEHFARWLAYFPREQFIVLDGDKFIRNPLSQLRLVEQFLNIGTGGIRADQLVYNPGKGFFCFRHALGAPIHCLGQSKGRRQMAVSRQFRRLLATHFAPHNRRFFGQLNREFPEWMSDRDRRD